MLRSLTDLYFKYEDFHFPYPSIFQIKKKYVCMIHIVLPGKNVPGLLHRRDGNKTTSDLCSFPLIASFVLWQRKKTTVHMK